MSSVCKIDNRFAEKNGRLLVGLETITPIIIAQYYKTDIGSTPATNGFTVSNLSSNQPNLVYYSKDYNTNPYMIDVSAAQFIPKSALTAVDTLDGGFRVAVDNSGRKYCLDGNLANVDGAYYIPDQVYDNYYVYVCRKVSDSAAQTYTPYFDMTTPYPSAVGMNVLYADLTLYGNSFPSFNLNNINIFSGVSANTAIAVSQLFGYGSTVHTELPPIDLMADCSFRTVYFDPQPINEMRNTTWLENGGESTIISGEGYKANTVYNSNLTMYGKNQIDSGGPLILVVKFSADTVSGSMINTDTSGFKCNYLVDSTATVRPEGNGSTGDYTIANSVVNSDIYWTGYTAYEHPNNVQQKFGASDYKDTNIYYTIRDHVYYTTDDNTYTDLKLASAIMSGTTAFNTKVYFTANHVATGYWYFDMWPWMNPTLYAEYEPTPTADNGTLKLYCSAQGDYGSMQMTGMNYTITAGTQFTPWGDNSLSTGNNLNAYGYSVSAVLTGEKTSLVFSGKQVYGISTIKLTKNDGTIIYSGDTASITAGPSWDVAISIPLT